MYGFPTKVAKKNASWFSGNGTIQNYFRLPKCFLQGFLNQKIIQKNVNLKIKVKAKKDNRSLQSFKVLNYLFQSLNFKIKDFHSPSFKIEDFHVNPINTVKPY